MSRVPETWIECTLGAVVDYGVTTKVEPEGIPADAWILELEDIEKDTSQIIQRLTFKDRGSKSTKNQFEKGDVLYGKLRPYLNKVVIADRDGFCTTEIIPLKADDTALDSRFLFYGLKHPRFLDYVTSVSHGLNMPRLGTDAGKAAPFVLAPFPEQKRIADKLDAVLGRVNACRARLGRVPNILKRFRQSVLAAATSGRLTENPDMKDWIQVPFEELLADKRKLSYGVLKPGDNDPSGVAMYRIVDIGEWGNGCNTQPSYISKELSQEFERTIIEKGDILLSVMATIGRSMVATDEMIGSNVNRAIAVIKPDANKVNSHYLNYYFLSPSLVREFEERSIGSAQVRINLTDLRLFTINLPPLREQQEIVRRIQTLFSFADRIEARLDDAQITIDRLTPSTLAKAFRGELVPQDPHDEPASALLERIKQQQSSSVTTKRPAKRRIGAPTPRAPKQKSIMTKSRFDDDVKGKAYLAGLLSNAPEPLNAEALFKLSELPLVDFYKQLAWEVQKGHIRDDRTKLEAAS